MRSTFKVLFYVNGSKEKNGIVPVSRLLNLMRYSSVLNANIRFFCSENRNFTLKTD